MESKHIKGLLIASGVAALALGGAIGGTFALFNRNLNVVSHVKVGNLNFSFSRTKLKSKVPNAKGDLEDKVDDSIVDLTQDGSKAFELENVVPGSDVEATFKLENTGGTAFKTTLELLNVKVTANGVTSDSASWLQYVSASVTEGASEKGSFTLKNLSPVDLSDLEKGANNEFALKLSFDAEAISNEAQDQELSFAIKLTMTQLTEARA